jgi:HrpA-like RNA helicase
MTTLLSKELPGAVAISPPSDLSTPNDFPAALGAALDSGLGRNIASLVVRATELPAAAAIQQAQGKGSDLASFWKNTYAEVRKELRRRYPKHAWPEDPLVGG